MDGWTNRAIPIYPQSSFAFKKLFMDPKSTFVRIRFRGFKGQKFKYDNNII